jgi:hypothetical protein
MTALQRTILPYQEPPQSLSWESRQTMKVERQEDGYQ